jgi:hypothetical protein
MWRKIKPYQPKKEDLDWANWILTKVKDGGFIVTLTGTYRVDKANKEVRLVRPPDPWDNPITALSHHRHQGVFAAIGWKVVPSLEVDSYLLPPDTSDWLARHAQDIQKALDGLQEDSDEGKEKNGKHTGQS